MSVGIGLAVAASGLLVAMIARHRVAVLLGIVGVGVAAGSFAADRHEVALSTAVPTGRGQLVGQAVTDALPYGGSWRFVVRPEAWVPSSTGVHLEWSGPAIAVIAAEAEVIAGFRVIASGRIRAEPGTVRGDPVAGRMMATEVLVNGRVSSPIMVAGNAFRSLVQRRTAMIGQSAAVALLRGFLIGDTTDLSEIDLESLRRAGLTHFVAVSGSNVALVLGAWWLVLGPTGAGNRIRAVTGLVVLAIFVVATRWESSVIRAATMASLVLGGRAIGIALDAWTALGGAVLLLLVVSGDLAYDVGFQLSAAATAGVLIGSRIWMGRKPTIVWALLGATLSAQLVVAPLLLLHFGSVPLLSPLANLMAAPLVTAATGLAGAGVILGWSIPLHLASIASGMVLGIARIAAEWPQLDPWATIALVGVLGVARATRTIRLVALVAGAIVAISMVPPGPPATPTVIALDVGQGDALLLRDPSGAVVLMDGGRETATLRNALRRQGVRRIDLVVASHGDADHVGGFVNLLDFASVGRVWIPDYAVIGDLLEGFVADVTRAGVPVDSVRAGDKARIGDFTIDVLGPQRRYATDNDGSVVLLVSANDRMVLLPGDIGGYAQADIEPPALYMMVVPHHGAATTDLGWLARTVGDIAVISVGPNTYGHPVPEVIATLEKSGARVLTTWEEGDISISLRE